MAVRLRFRFSLRTLLAVVAIAAVVFNYFALPSLRVYEFCRALKAGDYERAERLFVDREHAFPGAWRDHGQLRNASVKVAPMDWSQLWDGTRHMRVDIPWGDARIGEFPYFSEILAERKGLRIRYSGTH